MNIHPFDIIREPWITEKGTKLASAAKYFFRVHSKATKPQIRRAVEETFNVKVLNVNTMNVSGKWKRVRIQAGKTNDWKKAIVTLKPGQKIELT
ncbi:MAG: 50S ribosomal protein L23 [Candidatus Omnitrophica bacterium]|nr:50S ribosomal protein L23 [Candidatus Omnitrophota bacterium]